MWQVSQFSRFSNAGSWHSKYHGGVRVSIYAVSCWTSWMHCRFSKVSFSWFRQTSFHAELVDVCAHSGFLQSILSYRKFDKTSRLVISFELFMHAGNYSWFWNIVFEWLKLPLCFISCRRYSKVYVFGHFNKANNYSEETRTLFSSIISTATQNSFSNHISWPTSN